MTKVCIFKLDPIENFHGYKIETFDPMEYFAENKLQKGTISDLISRLSNKDYHRFRLLTNAENIDRLYRERDPDYMRMVSDFLGRFRNHDIIIMLNYNFIHPEILYKLKKPIKVLGFADDPYSTYIRGIPYLWAFDAAFYTSPGYSNNIDFSTGINRWTEIPTMWWPLVTSKFDRPSIPSDDFFKNRNIDLVYVGNYCGPKLERLIRLKKHFGERLRVHGHWPLNGYIGIARALKGRPLYPHRVTALSASARTSLYWNTKICINMHVSDSPSECGNMRTYEAPAHGMMMICDKASANGHAEIFEPNKEAVYYEGIGQAIELIENYLHHDEKRIGIAKAGYERFWRDYEWEKNLLKLLNWCAIVRRAH